MPVASTAPPRMPAGPTAASSAIPATAGGSTSGSSTSVTTSDFPRKERVASMYAAGVPTTRISAQRHRGGAQAEPERVERPRVAQRVQEVGRAAVDEDRQHGQREEGQRDRGGERERDPERGHGVPKPASASASAQPPSTSSSTKRRASSGSLAPRTTPAA